MAIASDAIPAARRHRNPSTTTAVFGMIVFLASDLMLFAGFFAAYFMLRGQTGTWPPDGVALDVLGAGVGTALLVTSSVTMHQATRAHRQAKPRDCQRWLAATAGLGILFALNQLRDYLSVDFSASDHAYGAIYWTLTGLHGLHVVTGIALISVLSWRLSSHRSNSDAAVEATGYFWHLVDGVWIALFLVIWVLQ